MTNVKIISICINQALETLYELKRITKVPYSAIVRQLVFYISEHLDLLDKILKENYDERDSKQ